MMPKAELLFKLQQVLSFQGWKDLQEGLYLRLRGFWGLCIEAAQIPTTLPLTLHFNSLCIFPIKKKIKHVFLVR